MLRIGVDTGGTFTDVVMLHDGRVAVHKVRSTPDDPSRAILAGTEELTGGGKPLEVVHGSTVATNAVLERKGARVALVATAGFEDVLRIGRQTRRELYNFQVEEPRPLVASGLTFGIGERLAADGQVVLPLDAGDLERVVTALGQARVDSVAVCLLHSYRNPTHEELVADRLARAGFAVSASHGVLPEYREFERWSTTVLDAYVTPLMARYLETLEQGLGRARLWIMQSNGGSLSAAAARDHAVRSVLSGPAAGVVGARTVAEAAGYSRVISFDMGGTSTDVSLVDGSIAVTTESTVGDFPLRLPVIDIHSVGAGGGSIVYVDGGGALRVGPRSAGADPGPVCYGKGSELTVTDANLLLGRLDPDYFLGGRMRLEVDRARRVARDLAAGLGLGELPLAEGIVRVANANMERALRVVSVQRGFDPRDFALVAFGGAGGMHACELAESLEIGVVIVPRHAGVLSALGTLLADVTRDFSQSVLAPAAQIDGAELEERFGPLVAGARAELATEGFAGERALVERALDVRYIGQSYEITVPFRPGYRDEFERRHARRYGYANPGHATEVVNLRVKAVGVTDKPRLPRATTARSSRPAPATRRPAWFAGREVDTAIFRRDDLAVGMSPGSMPLAREVYQEGLIIPPVKLVRRGEIVRDLLALILANVRTPGEREGDLAAQRAANRVAQKRLCRLVAKYGRPRVEAYAAAVQGYTERVLRRTIAGIPDGEYRFEDALDDDGLREQPIWIRVAVRIAGDGAEVDFTGSDPQTSGGVNANYAITLSATLYAFRCLVRDDILYNDGVARPIRLVAPEGTIVNAAHPAAVAGGNVETSQRITDVVLGALGRALPEVVPAASQGTMNNVTLGGADPRTGRPFAYYETIGGGMGGRNGRPGIGGVHTHMSNTRNTPVEAIEHYLPVRILQYALRRGSGGAGRFGGGDGIVREYEALTETDVTVLSDRRVRPPYGAQGGRPGACGRNTLIRDGEIVTLPGKVRLQLRPGDRLRIETPGGGGYGPPVD